MIRVIARPALALTALLAASIPAMAQAVPEPLTISTGVRVRIFAPDMRTDRYVGRVDSLDASVMVIDTAQARSRLGFDTGPVLVDQYRRVTIRLSAIRAIETSGGRTVRGALMKGMVMGALAGGLLFGLGNLPQVDPKFSDFVENIPAGIIGGTVVGGIIGFSLGGERWLPARLPR